MGFLFIWFVITLSFQFACLGAKSNIHGTDIDNIINSYIKCKNIPGLSISIVKNNEILLEKSYGLRNVERNLPMKVKTRINIGSLTKAFTATLLADGVSGGLITWDAPLDGVIPGFGWDDLYWSRHASVRDAMSHRIGMPAYWGVTTACLNITRQELVR